MTDRAERRTAKKRFGQHFLVDDRYVDRIVDAVRRAPGETVLEIGPGTGVLTGRLTAGGGPVIAVEIDRDLVPELRERFGACPDFRLIEADILGLDLTEVLGGGHEKAVVASNLPYNIAVAVIDRLVRHRRVISRAVVMVQREVARRLLSPPGSKEYGLTTLNLALYAHGKKLFDVPPGAFAPPPKVVSTVMELTFSDECLFPLDDEELYRVLTGAAFQGRRKMLRNTLLPRIMALGIDRDRAEAIMAAADIDSRSRPEEVPVAGYVAVTNLCAATLRETAC